MTKINIQTVIMARMINTLSVHNFVFNDRFISNEIDPGPASRGIAKGLNDISSFVSDSCFNLPLISLLCCAFNSINPDREIMIPPASFNA